MHVQVHENMLKLLLAAESKPPMTTEALASMLERMLRASRTSRRQAAHTPIARARRCCRPRLMCSRHRMQLTGMGLSRWTSVPAQASCRGADLLQPYSTS